MLNTGFHWLVGDDDMVSTGETYLGGDHCVNITKERLDADIAAKKVALWDVQGASSVVVIPLVGNYAAVPSGSVSPYLYVHGVFTEGLPRQSSSEKPRKLVYLATIRVGSAASGELTGTAENTIDLADTVADSLIDLKLKHPVTNATYTNAYTRGGAVTDRQVGKFIISAIDYPDGDVAVPSAIDSMTGETGSTTTPDTIGLSVINGLELFQELVISCNMGSLTCKGNALMARLY